MVVSAEPATQMSGHSSSTSVTDSTATSSALLSTTASHTNNTISTTTTASQKPAADGGRAALFTEVRNLIHANSGSYVKRLAEAIAIPSVSVDLDKRDSCFIMAELLNGWIQQLGGKSDKVLVGFQELDDGQRFDLPPVILAEFRDGPPRNGKPTLLIYSHYDVQAVDDYNPSTSSPTNTSNSDQTTNQTVGPFPAPWTTDPFALTERADGIDDYQINIPSVSATATALADATNTTTTTAPAPPEAAIAAPPGGKPIGTATADRSEKPSAFSNVREPLTGDSKLIGRGVACEKAPLLTWLWAVEAFREVSRELPINVKFMIEGMQESRSECVHDLIQRETTTRDGFLTNIDYVISPSGSWSTPTRPTLCYGLRGHASFEAEVRTSVSAGNNKPLHSGRWAGALNEPMGDVIHLLNYIQDEIESVPGCGHINQPPNDHIHPSEQALYSSIRGDLSDLDINITLEEDEEDSGNTTSSSTTATQTISQSITDEKAVNAITNDANDPQAHARESVAQVLMRKTCVPAFSIHGIEGGYSGSGVKPVIANVASGKFSIRFIPIHLQPQPQVQPKQGSPEEAANTNSSAGSTVATTGQAAATTINVDQHDLAAQIEHTVTQMLRQRFDILDSGNELSITSNTCDPWLTSPDSALMRAGQAALLRSFGFRADLLRDGNSLPVIPMLQSALGPKCQVMLMPMTIAPHDAAAVDESVDKHRYISAIYSAFVLLTELAHEHADRVSKELAAAPTQRKGPLGRLKDIWYGLS